MEKTNNEIDKDTSDYFEKMGTDIENAFENMKNEINEHSN